MTDPDAVTAVLREAAEVVEAAGLPADLRSVAFGKVVDLLAEVTQPQPAAAPGSGPAVRASRAGSVRRSGDKLESIATAFGVDRELVDDTFHLDGDEIRLSITSGQLDSHMGRAAQQIAVLVAAARQAAGDDEEWTDTATIRAVANDFDKLNRHFAEQLDELRDVFSFAGNGRGRRVKVKRTGYERAGELVRRLQGHEA
jgi:hypothetical protein